jgi:thioredoxin reductase (NADPH)
MAATTRTDVLIVGAGPAGLFAAFQLGLFGMSCHLVDALDRPGGQCAAFYADKPIYDMPAWPEIMAQELVDRLVAQAERFAPSFSFGRVVSGVQVLEGDGVRAMTDSGDAFEADLVVVASGFGPIRPKGGAVPVGEGRWPVEGSGLRLHEDLVVVDVATFETSAPRLFAIGDAVYYPGKLRLILSGFHEAALMTQAARRLVAPGSRTSGRSRASSRIRNRGTA